MAWRSQGLSLFPARPGQLSKPLAHALMWHHAASYVIRLDFGIGARTAEAVADLRAAAALMNRGCADFP